MSVSPAAVDLRRRIALELNRNIQNSLIKEHPLRELFWECTLRCNLHCRHCGSDCKISSSVKDMPLEDFLRVLDSVSKSCDPHKVFIVVTGGEPLMRPDLERCGKAFYDRGFPWGMVSNGFAFTKRRFAGLLASGLRSVTISLDGLGEDHEWMRGVKGSFPRAAEAIKMIASSGEVEYDVVTCVTGHNIASLPRIKDFLAGLGVKAWRLFTVFPVGRAAADPLLRLDGAQFRSLLDFIARTRKEGVIKASYGCEGFLGNYEGEVRDSFYFCKAGISTASVLADGSISACPSIRADYHQGNIYKDDFMDVWTRSFIPYRDRSWMKKGDCADCKWFRYCRGNGMHLRDGEGNLLLCHLKRLQEEIS